MKLIVGNWKMNGRLGDIAELDTLIAAGPPDDAELWIMPPATLVAVFAVRARAHKIFIGGQDCSPHDRGAYTGDIAAAMLADAGASSVIVGHSERRQGYGETDAIVLAKADAAIRAGLIPILCVGETESERGAGKALDVVRAQLARSRPIGAEVVVAYEPVWAIGTGRTPTVDEVAEVHAAIRAEVGQSIRILYGGSVKPLNAGELLAVPNVDGALVGGASLNAADFLAIAQAAGG